MVFVESYSFVTYQVILDSYNDLQRIESIDAKLQVVFLTTCFLRLLQKCMISFLSIFSWICFLVFLRGLRCINSDNFQQSCELGWQQPRYKLREFAHTQFPVCLPFLLYQYMGTNSLNCQVRVYPYCQNKQLKSNDSHKLKATI